MRLICQLAPCLAFFVAATSAAADLTARFVEGAPKDRFEITNEGRCSLGPSTVVIKLENSAGALVFDTDPGGAGVEVFQPLDVIDGQNWLVQSPKVADGDREVTLALSDLAPGNSVIFTIDVDDTLGAREITVNGSEIAGAEVFTTHHGTVALATFADNAQASSPLRQPC